MRIDENELPEGWDHGLVVERDADGAIRRVVAARGQDLAVFELDGDRMIVRETREVQLDSEPAIGREMALGALQGVIARSRGLACSFCGKPDAVAKKLFAGPNAWICDECVVWCQDILDEEEDEAEPPVDA